jgi:GMP synthase-like glutamine amidotransferase
MLHKEEISRATGMKVPTGRFHEIPKVEISYTSEQGKFRGVLPGREVFFMEHESTVENLSMLFAKLVRSKIGPEGYIRVAAYEGIAKGAVTSL